MNKLQTIAAILLLMFMSILPCFAQQFDGTYLSSTKPFYEKDPYTFEGSENYAISFDTDPAVIKALVPEPLQPYFANKMTFIYAKHRLTHPFELTYNEAYFVILVTLGSVVGGYIPVLYLDEVDGIIAGRELTGYNKVGGHFEIVEEDNQLTVTVTERDTIIIKAAYSLGDPIQPPEEPPGGPGINLKYIPSFVEGAPPDVQQLTLTQKTDKKTNVMRLGTATLEFHSTRFSPLGKIPILKIEHAAYAKESFYLTYGKIIYDYLKK